MFLWKGWTSQRRPMEFQTMEPCSPSKKIPILIGVKWMNKTRKTSPTYKSQTSNKTMFHLLLPGIPAYPPQKPKHIRFTTGNEHPENIIPSVHHQLGTPTDARPTRANCIQGRHQLTVHWVLRANGGCAVPIPQACLLILLIIYPPWKPETNIIPEHNIDGWKLQFPLGKAYQVGAMLVSGRVVGKIGQQIAQNHEKHQLEQNCGFWSWNRFLRLLDFSGQMENINVSPT